jgi:cytochrome c-type biogenesis protein CcmH/NrfG
MKAGLAAMYERKDARAAVSLFREVITNRADHYGATFQLAKALDQSGDSTAALPVWRRILDLARTAGDSTTAAIASSRIRIP